jgi:S1-C subfamily serine protease
LTPKSIYRQIKKATVALAVMDVENSAKPFEILGSGFCIDPSGIVVTCAHVVEAFMSKPIRQQIEEMAEEEHNRGKPVHTTGPKSQFDAVRVYAVFYDTESSKEQMIAIPSTVDFMVAKTDFDLAMVRLMPHPYFSFGYPTLEVIENYSDVDEGDEIALCGFPLGTVLQRELGTVTSSFTRGIVSSIIPVPGVDQPYLKGFQLNIAATYGNSGGPVFSLDSGKAFGVLARGVPQPGTSNLLPGIVKAEPIYPLLADDGLGRAKRVSLEEVQGDLMRG